VDVVIEVLGDSGELRDEAECIHDEHRVVVGTQEGVLVDDAEAISLHELLSESLGAVCAEDQLGYQSDADWNRVLVQILQRVECQVNYISLGQARADLIDFLVINWMIKWNIEDPQDSNDEVLGSLQATTAFLWPFLNRQQLIVPHH